MNNNQGSLHLIMGSMFSGKCLGKDTKVKLYNRDIVDVQDIVVGDLLMGDDCTPRKVMSVSTGTGKMYNVFQTYGDNYVVNDQHIICYSTTLFTNNQKMSSAEELYNIVNDDKSGKIYGLKINPDDNVKTCYEIGIMEHGIGEYFGFELDGNSKFLLGDNTVTHNSSSLITQLLRYKAIGKKVYCINSAKDTRSSLNVIKTHDNIMIDSCKIEKLADAYIPYNIEVIGIDEAQFFPDLKEFVIQKLKEKYTIIVAGLDGDYQRHRFGQILDLIPIADSFEKKYAFCKECSDGTPAPFTKKITSMESNGNILIGAGNEYSAVCSKHYNDSNVME
jgi:thymidine kinase